MPDPAQSGSQFDMRPFPMQDGPPIPWFLAEIIYRHLYRDRSQTLERLAERGGFAWREVEYLYGSKWSGDEHRAAANKAVREVLAS